MRSHPFLGIDYGTCNSSMAWFNPQTAQAEILRNAEGEEKTPSVVWFGPREVLVGKYAEERLEHDEDRKDVIVAAKRALAKQRCWRCHGRNVTPVDAAAAVLKKLKHDAEALHFHQPVTRAVITHPAIFDAVEKERLGEAARCAGFQEVALLAEPVAAAWAYVAAGLEVGRHVLVYDLGGGTFDLALVGDEGDGVFRLALEPLGLRIGGEDFDRVIYAYLDEKTQEKFGRGLGGDGEYDLAFLRRCRKYKENLSLSETPVPISWIVSGLGRLKLEIKRTRFEERIGELVEKTVDLTRRVHEEARECGRGVDTLILIGGSTRVPLVRRRLQEALAVKPLCWQHQDVAVALGAAYHAQSQWGESTDRVGGGGGQIRREVFPSVAIVAIDTWAPLSSGQIRREVFPSVAQGSSQEQSSDYYARRGESYWRLGEYQKAIADCDKAIQLDPNNSSAYAVRGASYGWLGEYPKAIADCDKAIQLDPNYSFAYAVRGDSYRLLGEYRKAIADCDKAIQLDPNYSFAYAARGESYRLLGEYRKAIADCDKAIQLDPNYSLAYAFRGASYLGLGEYPKAIADCDKAIQLDPNDSFAYARRGASYWGLGEYRKAIADCDKAIQLDPNNSLAYEVLMKAHQQLREQGG